MSVQNSHQISDIKVLLKIGANGNGIVSVEKTGTVGNVDTYTITFSDGTTTNFDLTNGTSIDTIEKTDTQGLVDTYTITLTDGSTTTFEVVNGGVEFGTLETETGNPLSFSTDSAQVANSTVITFEPIQAGSGDPSPSNVRPISGYDALELAVPRKNLINENDHGDGYLSGQYLIENGSAYSYSGMFVTRYTVLKASTEYTLSGIGGNDASICFYDANKNYLSGQKYSNNSSITFTTPSTAKYCRATGLTSGGSLMLEEGDEATTYEPYNPLTNIIIKLGSTICGGTLDVESGELTIYKGSKTYNGSENWEQSANPNACRIPVPSDMDTDNPDAICDTYTYTTTPNDVSYGFAIGSYIAIKDVTNCSTVAYFKTYLSGHNITFVYKLKNPITYHLTPHAVELLEGANVVTSNGTSIDLVYKTGVGATLADLKPLADCINAVEEAQSDKSDISEIDLTGTSNTTGGTILAGTYFYLNGLFCKALVDIASSATFTKGTNYDVTSIADELPVCVDALFQASDYETISGYDLPSGLYAFSVKATSLSNIGITNMNQIISAMPINNSGTNYIFCNVQVATSKLVVIINKSTIPNLFLRIWCRK